MACYTNSNFLYLLLEFVKAICIVAVSETFTNDLNMTKELQLVSLKNSASINFNNSTTDIRLIHVGL